MGSLERTESHVATQLTQDKRESTNEDVQHEVKESTFSNTKNSITSILKRPKVIDGSVSRFEESGPTEMT